MASEDKPIGELDEAVGEDQFDKTPVNQDELAMVYADTYAQLTNAGQKIGLTGAKLHAFINSRLEAIDRREEQKNKNSAELEAKRLELEMKRLETDERNKATERQFLLEKEKLHYDLECRKFEIELKSKLELKTQQSVRPHFQKLPVFDQDSDDIDAWINRFENVAKDNKWNEDVWASSMAGYLKGTALDIYNSLSTGINFSYSNLKKELLERFKCTDEGFRLKFRTSKPQNDESFHRFSVRLNQYLHQWIEMRKIEKTFDGLFDLIMTEQFYSSISKELSDHLKLHNCKTIKELVSQADVFRKTFPEKDLTRKGDSTITNGSVASVSNNSNIQTECTCKVSHSNSGFAGNRGSQFPQRGKGFRGQGGRGGSRHNIPFNPDIQQFVPNVNQTQGRGVYGQNIPQYRPSSPNNQFQNRGGFGNGQRFSQPSGQPMFQNQHLNLCYNCNSPGHLARNCPYPKQGNQASQNQNPAEAPLCPCHSFNKDEKGFALVGSTEPGILFSACSGKNLPIFEGIVNGQKGSILRDTGANVCGIRHSLVKPHQYNGKTQKVRTFGGRIEEFKLADIPVTCSLFTGDLECCVLEDPITDLILGNLAHENLSVDLFLGKVSCVTTRSMSNDNEKKPLKISNIPDLSIDKEQLIKLQGDDLSLKQCFESLGVKRQIHKSVGYFRMKDGLLVRTLIDRNGEDRDQIVVPKSLRDYVLTVAHEGLLSGHGGIRRTISRIYSNFFWPGIYKDVQKFCRECEMCQKCSPRIPSVPLEFMPVITEPFKKVAIDLAGPFSPPSEDGHRYILSVVCVGTRFVEAVPMKKIDTISVAEELITIFARMGFPAEIQSDCGSQFTSDMYKEILRLLAIKGIHTSPYHAQSNGVVERFHGSIKPMLRKVMQTQPKKWHRYLPALLFACRDMPNESTGFSPFELLFGRRPRGPIDLLANSWSGDDNSQKDKNVYQHVFELQNMFEDVSKIVGENIKDAAIRNKRYHDRKSVQRSFKVGDEILLLLPTNSNKLLMTWKGPYRVVEALHPNYKIDLNGTIKVFHANLLKRFFRKQDNQSLKKVYSNDANSSETENSACNPEMSMPMINVSPVCSDCVVERSDDIFACAAVISEDDVDELKIPTVPKKSETINDIILDSALEPGQRDAIMIIFDKVLPLWNANPGSFKGKIVHSIPLTTDVPVHRKQYPLPFASIEILEMEVRDMIELGVIEPSQSPYCAPVVLVAKKDQSMRLCIDFRDLNKITVLDSEPIPDMEVLFTKIAKAKYFTKIDLSKGYWQIFVNPKDRHKTAFQTPLGLFQWVRMPFGLVTAPATFARMMRMLKLEQFSSVNFFDDILVASLTWEEHLHHVECVLKCLLDHGLTVRPSKVFSGFRKLEFLGHIVGEGNIQPEKSKVDKMLSISIPKSRKQIRSLLGLIGYYRRYVPHFAELTSPITDLLKGGKGKSFVWTEDCSKALLQIQRILSTSPVLSLPDLSLTFIVRTDASSKGIGGVLLQESYSDILPISFVSRKLLDREQKFSTIERECLAIVWCIDKLSRYLWGKSFILETDHRPLTFLASSAYKNKRIMRWSLLLQEFSFEVRPISGEKNTMADLLSRSLVNQSIP